MSLEKNFPLSWLVWRSFLPTWTCLASIIILVWEQKKFCSFFLLACHFEIQNPLKQMRNSSVFLKFPPYRLLSYSPFTIHVTYVVFMWIVYRHTFIFYFIHTILKGKENSLNFIFSGSRLTLFDSHAVHIIIIIRPIWYLLFSSCPLCVILDFVVCFRPSEMFCFYFIWLTRIMYFVSVGKRNLFG